MRCLERSLVAYRCDLLAEPHEYRFDASRLGAELTGPYNIDRLHAAGVQIRMRKHRGLNHQKSVSLYGRGLTIFGSSNWSWHSFNFRKSTTTSQTSRGFFSGSWTNSIGSGTQPQNTSHLCPSHPQLRLTCHQVTKPLYRRVSDAEMGRRTLGAQIRCLFWYERK